MATNCSLYRDKIPDALKSFIEKEGNASFTQTTNREDQDVYKVMVGTANCFVNIYYKVNGLTSISYQSSKKLQSFGQRCVDFIIDQTSLPDSLHKTFTVNNSNTEQYEYFKEAAREALTLTEIAAKDSNVADRFKVEDGTGASLTITLYKNTTLFFQGRVTPLFVTMMSFALEWMVTEEIVSLANCIDLRNMVVVFDEDPRSHISNHSVLTPDAGVLFKLMRTSLQLANSGIVVSDYSCYTFDILRSIEGLLKHRLLQDVPPFNDFGDYFEKNRATGAYVFKTTCSLYDATPRLKHAMERAYTFFNTNRHSTFHVDDMIDTTRVLDYSEAISIIEQSFVHINAICSNWN